MAIHHGMSTRDALRAAEALGGTITQGKGDEIVIAFPFEHEHVTMKSTRKDASRKLTTHLMRAKKRQELKDARKKEEELPEEELEVLTRPDPKPAKPSLLEALTGGALAAPAPKPAGPTQAEIEAELRRKYDAPAPVREPSQRHVPQLGLTHSIEEITPAIAEEWLAKSAKAIEMGVFKNRPLKRPFIEKLAREIKTGLWDESNGESFKLAGTLAGTVLTGIVLDGQHRLHAIVRSGVTVRALVVRNVPVKSYLTIDSGTPRRVADVLTSAGNVDVFRLGAGLRLLWTIKRGRVLEDRVWPNMHGEKPASIELLEFLEQHPTMRDSTRRSGNNNANSTAVFPPSVSVVTDYLFHKVDPAKASEFFERVSSGDIGVQGSIKNNPIHRLREYVIRKRLDLQGAGMNQVELLGVVFKAWNRWCQGRDVEMYVLRGDEPFPGVSGLDVERLW